MSHIKSVQPVQLKRISILSETRQPIQLIEDEIRIIAEEFYSPAIEWIYTTIIIKKQADGSKAAFIDSIAIDFMHGMRQKDEHITFYISGLSKFEGKHETGFIVIDDAEEIRASLNPTPCPTSKPQFKPEGSFSARLTVAGQLIHTS